MTTRPIKFRAWAKLDEGNVGLVEWDMFRPQIAEWIGNEEKGVVLMQFTGFKDKNGKEIYEGDILHSGKTNWEVVWDIDGARYKMQTPTTYTDFRKLSFEGYIEVIGNVFENPDLLKTEPF